MSNQHSTSQELAALRQRVAELEAQLVERDRQLGECERQLVERDRQLVERDRQLVERDRQLVERDRQLVERDRQLVERDRQLVAREQEHDLLQTLWDHLPVSVYVKDRQSRFLFNNPESQRRLGVQSQAELDGKTDFDFLPHNQAEEIFAFEQHIMATGQPLLDHLYQVHNALGWRQVLNTKVPLYNSAGECVGLVGISHDVTEREALADALAESEARYRLISELTSDYVYQDRRDLQTGRIETLWASGAFERITGYTVEAVNALPGGWRDVILSEDRAAIERQSPQMRDQPTTLEYRIVTQSGAVRWLRDHFRQVEDAQGVITSIGAASDITEQKQAETRLRQLSQAVEQSPTSIVITDLDGRIEYANPKFTAVTGYTLAEVLGQNPRILQTGHTAPQEYKVLWDTITAGGEWRGEFHNRKKNGETYWELASISGVRDERGKITHYVAVKEEITRRKQAEEALRISEARHRQMFEHNHAVQLLVDPSSGAIVDANPAAAEFYGYSRDQLRAMRVQDINTLSDAEVRQEMQRAVREKRAYFQFIHRLASGELRHVEVHSGPIDLGSQTVLFSIITDVTVRFLIEDALRISEARHRALFERAYDAITLEDEHEQIIDANPAAEALFGYSHDELLTMRTCDLQPSECARPDAPMQTNPRFETLGRRKDGTVFSMEISLASLDEGGRRLYLGIIRDMTERQVLERAIRESEEYFRWLWSVTFEGIVIHDQGMIVDVNPALLAMLGYERDAMIDHSAMEFLTPESRERVRDVVTSKTESFIEAVGVRRDGTTVPLEFQGKSISLGGRALRAVAVRDLTERLEIEQQRLKVALEQERVGLLADFIRDVSHEFRTPLSVVGTNLYLISRHLPDQARTSYLEPIQHQVNYIHTLVEAMLTLSQLDSGVALRLLPTDLNTLLHDLAVSLQPRLEAAQLTLRRDLWPGLLPVQADSTMLFQALNNIVDNALDHTPPGGQITLRTWADAHSVYISIGDTGSGISTEDLPHIFDRFFRGDRARSTRGAGLGLSIAAKVIEKHGGRIEVASEVDQGTTITICLSLEGTT